MEKNKSYALTSEPKVNRQYKDRLFRFIFNNKRDLLELYNAVNGTDYQNEEELTINTLEGAIYMGMKNDISFIVSASLNLYEHQSTWNRNMPLRGLLYFSSLYQSYMKENGYQLMGSKRILLPLPNYVVFYNGMAQEPDWSELRLSDSFIGLREGEVPNLECRVFVWNINHGHNRELLKKCRKLGEYSEFVSRIRVQLQTGVPMEEAMERSIKSCIKDEILADILTRFRSEVKDLLLMEYDKEAEEAYIRKESLEIGREQGIEALIQVLQELGMSRDNTLFKVEEKFSLSAQEAEKYLAMYWEEQKDQASSGCRSLKE